MRFYIKVFTAFLVIFKANSFSFKSSHGFMPITTKAHNEQGEQSSLLKIPKDMTKVARMVSSATLCLSIMFHPNVAFADGQTKDFKFPPIDITDKNRCKLVSSKMGQANAARDKLYDLRQCDLSGKDAKEFDLSGVIMTQTDLTNAILRGSQFSKAFLHDSTFENADFSNAIIDRASFRGSNLKNAILKNTVLTGTSFENSNVENADFSDSYMGDFDIKSLCKNPTLKGENTVTGADTRFSVGGCPNKK